MSDKNIKNMPSAEATSILNAYQRRDFNALSKMNLIAPIDSDGNTIIHLMASKLDREGFQALKQINPNCLNYEAINRPNRKNLDLPIHSALKTIYANQEKNHSFIKFMIDELGASTNIPNGDNWIIARNNLNSKNTASRFNNTVMENLASIVSTGTLTLPEEKNIGCKNNVASVSATKNIPLNPDLEFIKILTDMYTNKTGGNIISDQDGGFSGKRKIKGVLSDFEDDSFFTETGDNDSFTNMMRRTKKINDFQLLINQDRVKLDPKAIEAYNEILRKIKELMKVDDDVAKIYRSALKYHVTQKNPELRKRENDAIKIKEIEKIFDDVDEAKKILDGINVDEVRKIMAEQREQAIANAQTKRTFRGKEENTTLTEGTGSENSDTPVAPKKAKATAKKSKDKKMESAEVIEEKPKSTKSKVKKIAENGYLRSDEIIFSPNF